MRIDAHIHFTPPAMAANWAVFAEPEPYWGLLVMPEVRRDLRNVWYDTAGSPLLFPTEAIFRTALGCVDHRKLLYGSDYPLLVYSRRQTEPDFQPFIGEIDALGLAPDVYEDIMGGNATRLPGLASAVETSAPSPRRSTRNQVITEITPEAGVRISFPMAVCAVAQAWPPPGRFSSCMASRGATAPCPIGSRSLRPRPRTGLGQPTSGGWW